MSCVPNAAPDIAGSSWRRDRGIEASFGACSAIRFWNFSTARMRSPSVSPSNPRGGGIMGKNGFQPEAAASLIKSAGPIRRIPLTGEARRVTDGGSAAGPLILYRCLSPPVRPVSVPRCSFPVRGSFHGPMAGAAIRRFWHSRPELDARGTRHHPDRRCTFVLGE
jgi:hypothetical protein